MDEKDPRMGCNTWFPHVTLTYSLCNTPIYLEYPAFLYTLFAVMIIVALFFSHPQLTMFSSNSKKKDWMCLELVEIVDEIRAVAQIGER